MSVYKEEDNWNLSDNIMDNINAMGSKIIFKIFIQKVKEDDEKTLGAIKEHKSLSTEFWRGYRIAMEDTKAHRDKRAGDLK